MTGVGIISVPSNHYCVTIRGQGHRESKLIIAGFTTNGLADLEPISPVISVHRNIAVTVCSNSNDGPICRKRDSFTELIPKRKTNDSGA